GEIRQRGGGGAIADLRRGHPAPAEMNILYRHIGGHREARPAQLDDRAIVTDADGVRYETPPDVPDPVEFGPRSERPGHRRSARRSNRTSPSGVATHRNRPCTARSCTGPGTSSGTRNVDRSLPANRKNPRPRSPPIHTPPESAASARRLPSCRETRGSRVHAPPPPGNRTISSSFVAA